MRKITFALVFAVLALAPSVAKADSQYFIGESTPSLTAVRLLSGAGQLTAVQVSSASAAGDACVFFDSASVSGITFAGEGTAVAPRIADVTATATNTSYTLPWARSFSNGIVAVCKGLKSAYAKVTQ